MTLTQHGNGSCVMYHVSCLSLMHSVGVSSISHLYTRYRSQIFPSTFHISLSHVRCIYLLDNWHTRGVTDTISRNDLLGIAIRDLHLYIPHPPSSQSYNPTVGLDMVYDYGRRLPTIVCDESSVDAPPLYLPPRPLLQRNSSLHFGPVMTQGPNCASWLSSDRMTSELWVSQLMPTATTVLFWAQSRRKLEKVSPPVISRILRRRGIPPMCACHQISVHMRCIIFLGCLVGHLDSLIGDEVESKSM